MTRITVIRRNLELKCNYYCKCEKLVSIVDRFIYLGATLNLNSTPTRKKRKHKMFKQPSTRKFEELVG
jgi:hypothetical protein